LVSVRKSKIKGKKIDKKEGKDGGNCRRLEKRRSWK